MKAERRHELRTNSLYRALSERLPQWGRQHGAKVALLVAFIALGALFIHQRIQASRNTAQTALNNVSVVRMTIAQLPDNDPRMAMDQANEITERLDQVQNSSGDPRVLVEAVLAKGDLNWHLANLPDMPATTQPTTRPAGTTADKKQALQRAEAAYQEILEKYADQPMAAAAARFGLAAIAENRHEWDVAKEQYQKVLNDESMLPGYRDQATLGLSRLEQIQQPVLLVNEAASTQPAAPTTAP